MKESVIYQEIVSTAEERGRDLGKREEGLSFVSRLLKHRFTELSPELQQQIENLSLQSLEELGEALLDVSSEADLAAWLQGHR